MGGRHRAQQRTFAVDDVVDSQDEDVKQIAAEQIADSHIDGAEPQRAHRHHEFWCRGRASNERRVAADVQVLEPERVLAEQQESASRADHDHAEAGREDVARS